MEVIPISKGPLGHLNRSACLECGRLGFIISQVDGIIKTYRRNNSKCYRTLKEFAYIYIYVYTDVCVYTGIAAAILYEFK